MGRKSLAGHPLTNAEKPARQRKARAERYERWRTALIQIQLAESVQDARQIAAAALQLKEKAEPRHP